MIKTKTWTVIILIILALALAACAWVFLRPAEGRVARIYLDGELYREIDLAALTGPERIEIKTDRGVNTVLAEPGRICVESADCPDRVCVDTGWISRSGAPIVCLPHRLVIRLEAAGEIDAVTG